MQTKIDRHRHLITWVPTSVKRNNTLSVSWMQARILAKIPLVGKTRSRDYCTFFQGNPLEHFIHSRYVPVWRRYCRMTMWRQLQVPEGFLRLSWDLNTQVNAKTNGKKTVLRIRIRNPVPFWPLESGSGMGKIQNPDTGRTSRIIFKDQGSLLSGP